MKCLLMIQVESLGQCKCFFFDTSVFMLAATFIPLKIMLLRSGLPINITLEQLILL